jgi:phospholipid/cholesterol/gamma-HCH transport system substrate-binding protein
LVRPSGSEGPTFTNAKWSDNLPKLLQSKVIESFENAGMLGSVSRPNDANTADHQLQLDIRSFQVTMPGGPVADVEFAARLLGNDGKIVAARIFRATAPAKATDAAAAAAALNEAFGKVAVELVTWTRAAI